MEFLKKNYEKVLLSLVLLGLAAAAGFLLLRVSSEKENLSRVQNSDVTQPLRELPPADLVTNEAVLRRLRRPTLEPLSGEHNLFNPVQWQKRPDGTLVKIVTGKEIGPGALTITKITPLYTIISFEGATALGSETLFRFKITREADRTPRKRSPTTMQAAGVGAKNEAFILREIRTKEDPKEFVLEMVDDNAQITVSKEKPYEGVAGHTADLRYDPDKQVFLNRRLDDKLVFAGDTNRIVAITATSVTVEAVSNKKRVTVELPAAARPTP